MKQNDAKCQKPMYFQIIAQSMSATSVERVSSPNRFAELQLTGIELATLVTIPSNSTTELRP